MLLCAGTDNCRRKPPDLIEGMARYSPDTLLTLLDLTALLFSTSWVTGAMQVYGMTCACDVCK